MYGTIVGTNVLIDPPCPRYAEHVICARNAELQISPPKHLLSAVLVMMRCACTFVVLFITLAVASKHVSAQSTAIINVVSYADGITNCTGPIISEDQYYVTGMCMDASQYFCDSSYFFQSTTQTTAVSPEQKLLFRSRH